MPFHKVDKEKIIRHVDMLCKETKEFPRLMAILCSRDIFTNSEKLALEKVEESYARNFAFYKLLVDKDNSGFEILLDALGTTGQNELANTIDSTKVEVEKTKILLFFNRKSVKKQKEGTTPESKASSTSDPDVVKEGKECDASNLDKNEETKNADTEKSLNEDEAGINKLEINLNKISTSNVDEDNKTKKTKQENKKNTKKPIMSNFIPGFLKRGNPSIDSKDIMQSKLAEIRTKENLQNLQKAFKSYDTSGDNKISVEEFYELMKKEYNFSEHEAKEFLKANDTDGDGEIDYFEFVSMFLPS